MNNQVLSIIELNLGHILVPAFVGTTSNSDMTGFEASGGCPYKGGWVVFVIFVYASVISCNVYVAQ